MHFKVDIFPDTNERNLKQLSVYYPGLLLCLLSTGSEPNLYHNNAYNACEIDNLLYFWMLKLYIQNCDKFAKF